MNISDPQVMESVVAANSRLSWDGWDVQHLVPDDNAMYKVDGVQRDGKWYRVKRFETNEKGWTIPDRLVKVHA